MSRIIAQLLGQPEPVVAKSIKQLEDKNGNPSHDVRHLAETIQRTRVKISDLGLDPDDTTAEELYHALLVKFQDDSNKFDQLHEMTSNDFVTKATTATRLIINSLDLPQRWVLKNTSSRKILHMHPPKKIMKQLNYRSVESFLKHENLSQVQLAASFLETATWQKDQARLLSKIDSSQCELGPISLGYMSLAKWGKLGSTQIAYNDDVGHLALTETGVSDNTSLLSLAILLVDALSEFTDVNLSKAIAKLSPALAWWSDMDGLIASLGSEQVSLNIKDASLNSFLSNRFERRKMESSRCSFWSELALRYENQLAAEEDNLLNLKQQIISFKSLPNSQPVFDYAESF